MWNETRTTRKDGRRQRRRGFTMIEAIVMVIIIGILSALIAPKLFKYVFQAKHNVSRANAASIKSQVNLFIIDCRQLRSTDSLREIMLDGPTDVPEGSWEPYLEGDDDLLDEWGKEFILRYPGEEHKHGFDIVSYGADGKPGGEDEDRDIIE